jgi:hypothetical protein
VSVRIHGSAIRVGKCRYVRRSTTWPTQSSLAFPRTPIHSQSNCNGHARIWQCYSTQAAHDRVQAAHRERSVYLRYHLSSPSCSPTRLHRLARRHVHSRWGTLLPRTYHLSPCALIAYLPLGPISESDFFTWEALICGPKDTPFVKSNLSLFTAFSLC